MLPLQIFAHQEGFFAADQTCRIASIAKKLKQDFGFYAIR